MNCEKKLSIFGGTGFVGGHFAKCVGASGALVPREHRTPLSQESVYFISTTHNYHVFDDVHKDVETNLTILLDTLKNLKPGSVFNFISSWFVYGDCELPATELTNCNPKGFYSITKRAAERLLISYCETFSIDYRIIRLCNVYGPLDQGVSKKKNALQYLIEEMRNNRPINLYYNGLFYRDYMHVEDVARAIQTCVEKAPLNSVINIGNGQIVFRDLIFEAKELLQSTSLVSEMPPPEFHNIVQVKDFYFDPSYLHSLGFQPQISISKGLRQLCQLTN